MHFAKASSLRGLAEFSSDRKVETHLVGFHAAGSVFSAIQA